jgi:hypothetical protein
MKKLMIILSVILATSAISNAQKAEFLYFKADLACCKAKSCNALEGDLKTLIEKNYPKGEVVFTTVKISDESNKDLVAKHNATSQTCILVVKKKKGNLYFDMSDLVKKFLVAQPDDKLIAGNNLILEIQKDLAKKKQ